MVSDKLFKINQAQMFYFSYLECNSANEKTFAVTLHPYKVMKVEGVETEEFSYGLNYTANMDFELYKLIMSN